MDRVDEIILMFNGVECRSMNCPFFSDDCGEHCPYEEVVEILEEYKTLS